MARHLTVRNKSQNEDFVLSNEMIYQLHRGLNVSINSPLTVPLSSDEIFNPIGNLLNSVRVEIKEECNPNKLPSRFSEKIALVQKSDGKSLILPLHVVQYNSTFGNLEQRHLSSNYHTLQHDFQGQHLAYQICERHVEVSILKIQRLYRSHLKSRVSAVNKIKRAYLSHVAKTEYFIYLDVRHQSVVTIQRSYRKHLCLLHLLASKIKHWYIIRRNVKFYLMKLKIVKCAITIQRVFRGSLGRRTAKSVSAGLKLTTTLFKHFRLLNLNELHSIALLKIHKVFQLAAIKIQSFLRLSMALRLAQKKIIFYLISYRFREMIENKYSLTFFDKRNNFRNDFDSKHILEFRRENMPRFQCLGCLISFSLFLDYYNHFQSSSPCKAFGFFLKKQYYKRNYWISQRSFESSLLFALEERFDVTANRKKTNVSFTAICDNNFFLPFSNMIIKSIKGFYINDLSINTNISDPEFFDKISLNLKFVIINILTFNRSVELQDIPIELINMICRKVGHPLLDLRYSLGHDVDEQTAHGLENLQIIIFSISEFIIKTVRRTCKISSIIQEVDNYCCKIFSIASIMFRLLYESDLKSIANFRNENRCQYLVPDSVCRYSMLPLESLKHNFYFRLFHTVRQLKSVYKSAISHSVDESIANSNSAVSMCLPSNFLTAHKIRQFSDIGRELIIINKITDWKKSKSGSVENFYIYKLLKASCNGGEKERCHFSKFMYKGYKHCFVHHLKKNKSERDDLFEKDLIRVGKYANDTNCTNDMDTCFEVVCNRIIVHSQSLVLWKYLKLPYYLKFWRPPLVVQIQNSRFSNLYDIQFEYFNYVTSLEPLEKCIKGKDYERMSLESAMTASIKHEESYYQLLQSLSENGQKKESLDQMNNYVTVSYKLIYKYLFPIVSRKGTNSDLKQQLYPLYLFFISLSNKDGRINLPFSIKLIANVFPTCIKEEVIMLFAIDQICWIKVSDVMIYLQRAVEKSNMDVDYLMSYIYQQCKYMPRLDDNEKKCLESNIDDINHANIIKAFVTVHLQNNILFSNSFGKILIAQANKSMKAVVGGTDISIFSKVYRLFSNSNGIISSELPFLISFFTRNYIFKLDPGKIDILKNLIFECFNCMNVVYMDEHEIQSFLSKCLIVDTNCKSFESIDPLLISSEVILSKSRTESIHVLLALPIKLYVTRLRCGLLGLIETIVSIKSQIKPLSCLSSLLLDKFPILSLAYISFRLDRSFEHTDVLKWFACGTIPAESIKITNDVLSVFNVTTINEFEKLLITANIAVEVEAITLAVTSYLENVCENGVLYIDKLFS